MASNEIRNTIVPYLILCIDNYRVLVFGSDYDEASRYHPRMSDVGKSYTGRTLCGLSIAYEDVGLGATYSGLEWTLAAQALLNSAVGLSAICPED